MANTEVGRSLNESSKSFNEHGLTSMQEAFAREYVINGGNGTKAAKDAGYKANGAHSRAYELMQLPKVQERMAAVIRQQMQTHVPVCLKSLAELAACAQSESVKLAAASTLLDRTGYKAPVLIEVSDNRSQADIDSELAVLLGLSDVIEGELADTSDKLLTTNEVL